MRALVGQRDERAVQSATGALEAELHHRTAAISSLAALASAPGKASLERMLSASSDLTADFDGGMAFVGTDGRLLANTQEDGPWFQIVQKAQGIQFASASEPEPVISNRFTDPGSKRIFVIISVYSPSLNAIAAGAFSPDFLAAETLTATYPAGSQATAYLLDSSR